MFYRKMFWLLLTLAATVLGNHFEQPLWYTLAVFAGVMWAKAEVFHLSFDATLAAIKHYEDTTADIEEGIEDTFESDHDTMTLDSETFKRRIAGMDEFS